MTSLHFVILKLLTACSVALGVASACVALEKFRLTREVGADVRQLVTARSDCEITIESCRAVTTKLLEANLLWRETLEAGGATTMSIFGLIAFLKSIFALGSKELSTRVEARLEEIRRLPTIFVGSGGTLTVGRDLNLGENIGNTGLVKPSEIAAAIAGMTNARQKAEAADLASAAMKAPDSKASKPFLERLNSLLKGAGRAEENIAALVEKYAKFKDLARGADSETDSTTETD
jgi:hypothetical protein